MWEKIPCIKRTALPNMFGKGCIYINQVCILQDFPQPLLLDVLCACAASPGLSDDMTLFVRSINCLPVAGGPPGGSLGNRCCPLERPPD